MWKTPYSGLRKKFTNCGFVHINSTNFTSIFYQSFSYLCIKNNIQYHTEILHNCRLHHWLHPNILPFLTLSICFFEFLKIKRSLELDLHLLALVKIRWTMFLLYREGFSDPYVNCDELMIVRSYVYLCSMCCHYYLRVNEKKVVKFTLVDKRWQKNHIHATIHIWFASTNQIHTTKQQFLDFTYSNAINQIAQKIPRLSMVATSLADLDLVACLM
jgi:hypothetical protein